MNTSYITASKGPKKRPATFGFKAEFSFSDYPFSEVKICPDLESKKAKYTLISFQLEILWSLIIDLKFVLIPEKQSTCFTLGLELDLQDVEYKNPSKVFIG